METAQTLIRPDLLSLTPEALQALLPYLVVFAGSVVALLFCVIRAFNPKWLVTWVAVVVCAAAGYLSSQQIAAPTQGLLNGMMVSDAFSSFFNIVFLACAGLTCLASVKYLDREKLQHPEYYVLVLFSALGMMLMTSALDLVVTFIALEIMSLAVYVLVGFRRADRKSNEAAIKYFILGSAASAIFLYGVALLFGATGTMNTREILSALQAQPELVTPMFTLGAWLAILGFLFKVASVPFHMWMPDVYEGAPAPVTGFMTTGLKAAAFATLIRLVVGLGYGKGLTQMVQEHLHTILWSIAALTMVVGNVVALSQTNLKRMLAYSSIAHTGYLLVGFVPGGSQGYGPVVMYLTSYAIMNLGAFVVLSILAKKDDSGLNLQDLSGLSQRRPWLAFALSVFLLSMAGIPPTAGFAAKYLLFYSAVQAGEIPLVIVGVLASAVSVYYYLRVLVFMYMKDPVESADSAAAPTGAFWASLVAASLVVLTFQVGFLPARLLEIAKRVALGL